MVVWVEGSDKRKPTNGPVLKLFYDNETDQWVSPDDTTSLGDILGCGLANFQRKGKPDTGKNRLYCIIMSETVFLIWKQ